MKVSTAGAQTVLQFTVTDPTAAKGIIKLYDQENLWDGETVQPKSVTWKLFVNTKTWQTEKLIVDLSYVLVSDGAKDTYTTKIEAKYSKNNKGAAIVKPSRTRIIRTIHNERKALFSGTALFVVSNSSSLLVDKNKSLL